MHSCKILSSGSFVLKRQGTFFRANGSGFFFQKAHTLTVQLRFKLEFGIDWNFKCLQFEGRVEGDVFEL